MGRRSRWLRWLLVLCTFLAYVTLTPPPGAATARRPRPPAPAAPVPYQPPPTPPAATVAHLLASLECLAPPAAWGPPSRVELPTFHVSSRSPLYNWTHPISLVYHDVLLAEDATCARLTRAHGRVPAQPGDSEHCVLATHMDTSRLPTLLQLSQRWQGCISVAVRLCQAEELALLLHWRELHAQHLRARITYHLVLGRGIYPNVMRTAPLAPFAPWAAGGPAGLPAPWVLVTDADALPSASAAVLAAWVGAAAAGTLRPQGMPPGPLPPYLQAVLHANNSMGLAPPPAPYGAPPHPQDLPSPQECAAWDGRPQPLQCSPIGLPTAGAWARRNSTRDFAARMSHCPGRPAPPSSTLVSLPSFEVQLYEVDAGANWSNPREASGAAATLRWNEQLRNASVLALAGVPSSAPPVHAQLLLWSLLEGAWEQAGKDPVVHVQAVHSFPPSYSGLIPWTAWLLGSVGPMPLHYSEFFEPYFVAKAPLPSVTHPPRWATFDEDFGNTWFDKSHMLLSLAGSGRYTLQLLPQVYLLNDHELDSKSTAPKSKLDEHRKGASYDRLVQLQAQLGLHCPGLCPCIPKALIDVMPEQGFLLS